MPKELRMEEQLYETENKNKNLQDLDTTDNDLYGWNQGRKINNFLGKTEMRILRTCTLRDRIHNEQIRNMCEMQDIVKWMRQKRREWDQHISRMSGSEENEGRKTIR